MFWLLSPGSSRYKCAGIFFLASSCLLADAPRSLAAETPSIPSPATRLMDILGQRVREVFEASQEAVVQVEAENRHGIMSGTGFFIDPLGTVVTSFSLASEPAHFTVSYGHKRFPAKLLLTDPRSGIALLKVDAITPSLNLGLDSDLNLATPVVSIGYPLGLPVSPSPGFVTGFDPSFNNRFFSTTHIRADVKTQPGQAGSPVLTLDGKVIGLLVSQISEGAGCHILPIRAAEKVRSDYYRFGHVMHGWVGVAVEPAAVPSEGSTAEVAELLEHTPAAQSGIQSGDIVVQVGNVSIQKPIDVLDASYYLTAGDPVAITVVRGGERLTFSVNPAFHPALRLAPAVAISRPTILRKTETLTLQQGQDSGEEMPVEVPAKFQ